jgi:hypothetical protein
MASLSEIQPAHAGTIAGELKGHPASPNLYLPSTDYIRLGMTPPAEQVAPVDPPEEDPEGPQPRGRKRKKFGAMVRRRRKRTASE